MKAPIRILVVDDSVVIRKLLTDSLALDPALEVVGIASNGRVALAKIPLVSPDLVTLDIEMPEMNGLEALVELRKLYPRLPVIMFSTLTEHGAAATLEALTLGAADYATKPSNTGSMELAAEAVRNELIPKIKALCGAPHAAVPPLLPPLPPTKARWPGSQRIDIVAIGASTGGPNALLEVVPRIPRDFPVPVLIVQHMPPLFTRYLAHRLAALSAVPVGEGAAGVTLAPGQVWIAPGDFHMTVTGGIPQLKLNQDPPENSCRPSADVLFRSVAASYKANVLGVVMTGMGADGTIGARNIRAAGGEVIIQDRASSVVWGMPGSVHASGLANGVYPLESLAQQIIQRVLARRLNRAARA